MTVRKLIFSKIWGVVKVFLMAPIMSPQWSPKMAPIMAPIMDPLGKMTIFGRTENLFR